MTNEDFKIKIPDKYYDMTLIDIQTINDQLLYIFMNDSGYPIYYLYDHPENFYYFEDLSSSKYDVIKHKNDLVLRTCHHSQVYRPNQDDYIYDKNTAKPFLEKYGNKILFGDNLAKDDSELPDENFNLGYRGPKLYMADLPVEIRHSLDYYKFANSEKQNQIPNVCYYDIEVYSGESGRFPLPDKAEFPINAITVAYNFKDDVITYLLNPDNNQEIPDKIKYQYEHMEEEVKIGHNLFIFNNEIDMIKKFLNDLHTSKSIIITGWNSNGFDFPYLYNRLKNLKIPVKYLSRFGYVDMGSFFHGYGDPICAGYVVADMLVLYKELTQNRKEQYSLSFIAKEELHDDKIGYTGDLDSLYANDITKFIKYNRQDVHLLKQLDAKVGHIQLQDELRKKAGSTWKYGTPSRLVDSLIIKTLEEQGFAANNMISRVSRRKAPGAYVANPVKPGLGIWVADLDAASLYPSIARTLNIGPNTYVAKIDKKLALKLLYDPNSLDDNDIVQINMDPNNVKTSIYKDIHNISIKDLKQLLKSHILAINGCIFKNHETEKSIYYDLFNYLYISRKQAKKLMLEYLNKKDIKNYDRYNNIQMTYKVLMNSIYGVLGSKFFRFMVQDLVEAITMTGKEVIKITDLYVDYLMNELLGKPNEKTLDEQMIEQFELPDVNTKYAIYTDTDSTMIEFKDLVELEEEKIGKKLSDEKIIKFILKQVEYFQNKINNELMPYINKKRNISKEHNYFQFKNEWIARRTWFLTSKKKYALHKLFLEGEKVNQIETKGLDTERSDYPNRTKEILFELLNKLLKTEWTYDEIMEFVDEKRIELRNIIKSGNVSISKPVSWAKETYKKRKPSHIIAMENWNTLEYEYFQHGNKGYLFYIKGVDREKYIKAGKDPKNLEIYMNQPENYRTIIAVPQFEEKLPNYYIVDIDRMLNFVWEDRWKILLEPINIKDRKGKINDEVFNEQKGILIW